MNRRKTPPSRVPTAAVGATAPAPWPPTMTTTESRPSSTIPSEERATRRRKRLPRDPHHQRVLPLRLHLRTHQTLPIRDDQEQDTLPWRQPEQSPQYGESGHFALRVWRQARTDDQRRRLRIGRETREDVSRSDNIRLQRESGPRATVAGPAPIPGILHGRGTIVTWQDMS